MHDHRFTIELRVPGEPARTRELAREELVSLLRRRMLGQLPLPAGAELIVSGVRSPGFGGGELPLAA